MIIGKTYGRTQAIEGLRHGFIITEKQSKMAFKLFRHELYCQDRQNFTSKWSPCDEDIEDALDDGEYVCVAVSDNVAFLNEEYQKITKDTW